MNNSVGMTLSLFESCVQVSCWRRKLGLVGHKKGLASHTAWHAFARSRVKVGPACVRLSLSGCDVWIGSRTWPLLCGIKLELCACMETADGLRAGFSWTFGQAVAHPTDVRHP